jgi:hypothetical protein
MHRTADEAREEYIRSMGKDLGELYNALWQDIAGIHSKWQEYVVMYGTKESRVDLLNQAAPRFARLVQDVLWDDVVLHLARLIDSPRSAGKPTLSIRALPDLITDSVTQSEVIAAVNAARAASEFSRPWRNRRLAHQELALAIEPEAQPLTPASRLQVNHALQSLTETLNIVSQRYLNSTSRFDNGSSDMGGALSLLHVLHDGVQTKEARRARLESGNLDLSDMPPRDL